MGSAAGATQARQDRRRALPFVLDRDCSCGANDRLQLVRPASWKLMSLLPLFGWFDSSAVGEAIRASTWLFPVIEVLHLLGLAVIGGAVLLVDMRLLGLGLRHQPVAQLARDAQRWFVGSLIVMLASGALLFTSEA